MSGEYIPEKEMFIEATSVAVADYFNARWGQGAPVPLGEAELVARLIWDQLVISGLFPKARSVNGRENSASRS